MPIINFPTREVILKIVLHGPTGSGRATTLAKLHADSPASKSNLATPAGGTTLAFSFFGEEPSVFENFKTRFEFPFPFGFLRRSRAAPGRGWDRARRGFAMGKAGG